MINTKTQVENIYAAGDVIGWPSLASAAYDQGRCAGANMSGEVGVNLWFIFRQAFIPFQKFLRLVKLNKS